MAICHLTKRRLADRRSTQKVLWQYTADSFYWLEGMASFVKKRFSRSSLLLSDSLRQLVL
jgi:hypothetical protein